MFRFKNPSRKPALACGTKMFELRSKKTQQPRCSPVPSSPGWFGSASSSTAPVCWPGPRSWACCCRTALKAGAASSGGPPGPSLWSGEPASHLGLENTQLGRRPATGRSRPIPALLWRSESKYQPCVAWTDITEQHGSQREPDPCVLSPPSRRHLDRLWPVVPACCVCALKACAGLTHCGGACEHVISLGKLLVQPSGRLLVGGADVN